MIAVRFLHHVSSLAGLLVTVTAATAGAQQGLPWFDQGGVPMSASAESVVVPREDLPVFSAPRADAPRRGSLRLGARLPLFAAHEGPGCAGRWLMVGPLAWVCRASVDVSEEAPLPWSPPKPVRSDGLPYSYWFVGKGGSAAYGRLEFADEAEPEQEMQPGFGLAVVEQRSRGGQSYGLTHHGLWVPMRDLIPVRPFGFHGEEIPGGEMDLAWVLDDRTAVFTKPDGVTRAKETKARFDVVRVKEDNGKGLLRIGDAEWVRAKDVRRPRKIAPPVEIFPGERWIDVEIASQTLVVYQGETPVFATMVSTGRGGDGTPTATPKGVHRIWVKLESSTMGNLDDENASSTYEIEDVPWVQFFVKGVALHGTFWHHGFGRVHSHGCVNLSPLDAARVFRMTGPHIPSGWSAALPTELDLGTVVRVR